MKQVEAASHDVTIQNHGSIARIVPHTKAARAWIDEHIGPDNGYQPYYPNVIVEPRYVEAIIEGMTESGLVFGS